MGKKELILSEIEQMPDMFLEQILEFVRSLKTGDLKEKLDISVASESSLNKDWIREEENDAWRDL